MAHAHCVGIVVSLVSIRPGIPALQVAASWWGLGVSPADRALDGLELAVARDAALLPATRQLSATSVLKQSLCRCWVWQLMVA